MEFQVTALADMDPKDALVIVAFPSTGAASPIAGRFLIERLNMPLVGHLDGPGFANARVIEHGVPTSPVRIHGGDVACEVDGPCRRVYLISTEVPLPAEIMPDLARDLIAWAKEARLVLTLEAIERQEGDDTPDVYLAGTTEASRKCLAPTKAQPLAGAMVTGITAPILAFAPHSAALMVEALADQPDGRAAAALVRALDPLIPQIKVDATPLEEDAQRIEKEVQKMVRAAPSHSFI